MVGGRFKREGTYIYQWLRHVGIWQKPEQYCNYPPIKNNFFKNEMSTFLKLSCLSYFPYVYYSDSSRKQLGESLSEVQVIKYLISLSLYYFEKKGFDLSFNHLPERKINIITWSTKN